MLKREIEETLLQWKNQSGHNPLVIKGVRQCGKTYIVKLFAQLHYESVVGYEKCWQNCQHFSFDATRRKCYMAERYAIYL